MPIILHCKRSTICWQDKCIKIHLRLPLCQLVYPLETTANPFVEILQNFHGRFFPVHLGEFNEYRCMTPLRIFLLFYFHLVVLLTQYVAPFWNNMITNNIFILYFYTMNIYSRRFLQVTGWATHLNVIFIFTRNTRPSMVCLLQNCLQVFEHGPSIQIWSLMGKIWWP